MKQDLEDILYLLEQEEFYQGNTGGIACFIKCLLKQELEEGEYKSAMEAVRALRLRDELRERQAMKDTTLVMIKAGYFDPNNIGSIHPSIAAGSYRGGTVL